MEFLGENFFEKKFSPNPFQKAFIWKKEKRLCRFFEFCTVSLFFGRFYLISSQVKPSAVTALMIALISTFAG